MDISAIKYLKAKFGDKFEYTYHVYPEGQFPDPQFAGELEELLEEFKSLLQCDLDMAVQTQNPRSKGWVVIDKKIGALICSLHNPLDTIIDLFKTKKKGCLYGKTEKQKIRFFNRLRDFAIADSVFFNEQYRDLLPHERKEFNLWAINDFGMKTQLSDLMNFLAKLLKANKKPTL
jgi:hypothetical protein